MIELETWRFIKLILDVVKYDIHQTYTWWGIMLKL